MGAEEGLTQELQKSRACHMLYCSLSGLLPSTEKTKEALLDSQVQEQQHSYAREIRVGSVLSTSKH